MIYIWGPDQVSAPTTEILPADCLCLENSLEFLSQIFKLIKVSKETFYTPFLKIWNNSAFSNCNCCRYWILITNFMTLQKRIQNPVKHLKLMNHDISNVGQPHTFKSIEILLRKDNWLLIQKSKYWHSQLSKAFWYIHWPKIMQYTVQWHVNFKMKFVLKTINVWREKSLQRHWSRFFLLSFP